MCVRSVRPRYIPLPYQDAPDSGRLILRDGSTATVRTTRPDDKVALTAFFGSLSDESKIQRFFGRTVPSAKIIESFCDSSNPRASLSLIVTRLAEPQARIIAAGTYMARNETTAEIALSVDDAFQGKGIGTLLLERLALLAVANGFRRFWAVTQLDNRAMLDVFRNSGFECLTKTDGGYIEIDLSAAAKRWSPPGRAAQPARRWLGSPRPTDRFRCIRRRFLSGIQIQSFGRQRAWLCC